MNPAPARTGTVAVANHRLAATGTVRKSIEIAHALAAAGVSVELWVTEDGGELRAEAGDLPVTVTGGGGGLSAVLALARHLRARRPAVLLSGGKHFHLRAGLGLLLSGRRRRIRFVGRASNSLVRPGRTARQVAISRLAQGAKYAAMDEVIAISHALAAEVADLPGIAPPPKGPRIVAIVNGVDAARVRTLTAAPAEHRWLENPALQVAVTVGRIDPQKGVDVLLRAMARLPDHWRLIMIGTGEPAYVTAMTALAQSLGIANRVDFAGHRSNPFAIVARADLFVLASRWEGAPNALLEALVCGIPIAATDCAGNREILRDGEFGSLAAVDDDAGLAAAMAAEPGIARDPAARQRMLEQRTIERCLADYVAVLSPDRPSPVLP